jgi:muconolactone delta-isomerase
MQFAILTRRRMDEFPADTWTPDLIAEESNRVREMYAAGSVRSIWRRKDMPGSLIHGVDSRISQKHTLQSNLENETNGVSGDL